LAENKTGNDEETFAAYFYVGLPHAHAVIRPAIDQQEMLHLLSASVSELFSTMAQIADEGRPDLAVALLNSTLNEIRARFQRYLVPKELPPLLPQAPGISVLDIDYWLSFNAFGMCLSVAQRIPSEERGHLNDQMEHYISVALRELSEWEARHDRHNGTTPEQRMAQSEARGIYSGALSEADWYRHAATLAMQAILPFCRILADQEQHERIRGMDHMARLLVTRKDDVSSDGTVADAALIHRIREGIPQQCSVVSFEDKSQENVTIDILEQAVNKSDLANLFGVVRRALREPKRAIDFFKLARDLADDEEHSANAESNLANVLRETGQTKEALKQFLSPLKLQLSARDYHNAAISFQNMIFTSATTQQEVSLEMLEELLEGVEGLPNVRDRAESLARVLNGVSIYHAAFKRYGEAERWAERFNPLLEESYPPQQVFLQFDGLAEWYHRVGDPVRAAEREFANAKQLEKCGHRAEATRSYATAAIIALQASEGSSRKLMSFYLEASVEAARLLPSHPRLMQDIHEIIRGLRANVAPMFEFFSRANELEMAGKALRAQMAWEEVDKTLK
jgi:tetratricopeptide (TPR) repeat protein